MLESILAYKQLVPQFEELSGTSYPSELKSATITKCSDAKLREHLQLTIQDTTTYAQLREVVLNYEKASKSWIGEAVLKSIQNTASHDDGGPRPMEVDRIEAKGKNKGKGKGKYGKGWQSFGSSFLNYGRGRGNNFKGRGRGKGKGKSKGKNKGKSKNGGKQTKGKQKGKVDAQQCRICHEYGHWARECPNRVNQVEQVPQQSQQQMPLQPSPTSTMRTTLPNSSTSTSTVRRIYNIPMGIPTLTSSSGSSVRMVREGECEEQQDIVILDSGSDVSLLPLNYGGKADSGVDASTVHLRDCQGQRLQVSGYRNVSLLVNDRDGSEAEIEHCFLIGDVKSCILSLGQLYESDWHVRHGEGNPVLESSDGTLQIPVFYQRNSLAINATVCRVEEFEQS